MQGRTIIQRALLGSFLTLCGTHCGGAGSSEPTAALAAADVEPDPPGTSTDDGGPRPTEFDSLSGVAAGDYYLEKFQALALGSGVYDGDYVMSVVPLTAELAIAEAYPTWVAKRYSREQMLAEARSIKRTYGRAEIYAVLAVFFRGDLLSESPPLALPDDLREYITLDNDRGRTVRCTKAQLPLIRTVSAISPDVAVPLHFPTRDSLGRNVTEGANWLRFTVSGLGFSSEQIIYPAPLAVLFDDAPAELRELFAAARSDETGTNPRDPRATAGGVAPPAPVTPASVSSLEATSAEGYADAKIIDIFHTVHVREGNFVMTVIPTPPELTVAQLYPIWREKRYDAKKMTELAREQAALHANKLYAKLVLVHSGDMMSGGEHSKQIPADIAEYVFIENDRGQSARCATAVRPLMALAGPFSKQIEVVLEFALDDAEGRPLVEGAKEIRFVVGGLGFTANTISFRAPLSSLFLDAPAELAEIYQRAGIR